MKLEAVGIVSLNRRWQRRKLRPREESSWLKVTRTVQP